MENKWNPINLEQGTQEWLEWRKSGLGGTDAATLMGLNPYDSVESLWEVKTGKRPVEFTKNAAMENGVLYEPIAREAFIKHTGENVIPMCGSHKELDFLKVSLDGISPEHDLVLEVKCPINKYSFLNHKKRVPKYYYCQMQSQLFVTQAEVNCFFSFFEGQFHLKEVYPDKNFQDELRFRAERFWEFVTKDEFPDVVLFEEFDLEL